MIKDMRSGDIVSIDLTSGEELNAVKVVSQDITHVTVRTEASGIVSVPWSKIALLMQHPKKAGVV